MYAFVARAGAVAYDILVPATRSYWKGVIETTATQYATDIGVKKYRKIIKRNRRYKYKSSGRW